MHVDVPDVIGRSMRDAAMILARAGLGYKLRALVLPSTNTLKPGPISMRATWSWSAPPPAD